MMKVKRGISGEFWGLIKHGICKLMGWGLGGGKLEGKIYANLKFKILKKVLKSTLVGHCNSLVLSKCIVCIKCKTTDRIL